MSENRKRPIFGHQASRFRAVGHVEGPCRRNRIGHGSDRCRTKSDTAGARHLNTKSTRGQGLGPRGQGPGQRPPSRFRRIRRKPRFSGFRRASEPISGCGACRRVCGAEPDRRTIGESRRSVGESQRMAAISHLDTKSTREAPVRFAQGKVRHKGGEGRRLRRREGRSHCCAVLKSKVESRLLRGAGVETVRDTGGSRWGAGWRRWSRSRIAM